MSGVEKKCGYRGGGFKHVSFLQHVHPYLGKNSTQMIEQDLLLEGSRLKDEDKQVPGRYKILVPRDLGNHLGHFQF